MYGFQSSQLVIPNFICFSVLLYAVPPLLCIRSRMGMVMLPPYTRTPAITGTVPL